MNSDQLLVYLQVEVPKLQVELRQQLASGELPMGQAVEELNLLADYLGSAGSSDPRLAPRAARAVALGTLFLSEGITFLNRCWKSDMEVVRLH